MRKFAYISTFFFVFIAVQASAKVWVVNADGTGNFITLTAAIGSAASGDTIFVAPGGYVESPPVTSKTLTVLGMGFSSDSTATWSIILNSTLYLGIGSVLSGLELRGPANPLIELDTNSTIEKCHLLVSANKTGIQANYNLCVVRQNIIQASTMGSSGVVLGYTGSSTSSGWGSGWGATVLNNLIYNFYNAIIVVGGADAIIANNVILANGSTAISFYSPSGAGSFVGKVFSNICIDGGGAGGNPIVLPGTYYCAYNDVWGNINNTLPSFDVGSISSNPEFVNYSSTAGYVYGTSNLHLAAGSPCIDAGEPNVGNNDRDGSRNDMGIYGGPEMFDDSGTPIYPCVIDVIVSPYAAPLNGTITIKALGRIGQ